MPVTSDVSLQEKRQETGRSMLTEREQTRDTQPWQPCPLCWGGSSRVSAQWAGAGDQRPAEGGRPARDWAHEVFCPCHHIGV